MTFSAQKNQINPRVFIFLLGANSLLNSWYEFNPFTFHSQECWNYCLQEIQDAFRRTSKYFIRSSAWVHSGKSVGLERDYKEKTPCMACLPRSWIQTVCAFTFNCWPIKSRRAVEPGISGNNHPLNSVTASSYFSERAGWCCMSKRRLFPFFSPAEQIPAAIGLSVF